MTDRRLGLGGMLLIAVEVISSVTVPAFSEPAVPPMPVYDVAAFCAKHASDRACPWGQYFQRLAASKLWAAMTLAVRAECVAVNIHHDYSLFERCLESHLDYFDWSGTIGPRMPDPTVPAMPDYDVAAVCAGKEYDSCALDQYGERESAATIWKFATPEARAQCLALNKGHDYKVLNQCIRLDQNALGAALKAFPVRTRSTVTDLPDYKIGDLCRNVLVSRQMVTKDDVNACWRTQNAFERWARTMWAVTTPAVRAECAAVNTAHDYELLSMCLESHQNDKSFQAH